MKIISLAHQKGGVGKSTTAQNLAYALGTRLNVAILDVDPQGSINKLDPGDVNLLHCSLSELESLDYDIVLIDTPPYKTNFLNEIFNLSDIIIVPMKTGAYDLLAVVDTIGSMDFKQRKKAKILFNMVIKKSSLFSSILNEVKELKYKYFESYLTNRVSYGRCVLDGGILKSKDKNAVNEFENFCNELIELL